MTARLATARAHFHVDVSAGDPITPPAQQVRIPRLLGGEITARGYPLAMVYSEKIVTAIARGTVNTRWRDFADIYLLTRRHPVDGAELCRLFGSSFDDQSPATDERSVRLASVRVEHVSVGLVSRKRHVQPVLSAEVGPARHHTGVSAIHRSSTPASGWSSFCRRCRESRRRGSPPSSTVE